MRILLDTCTVIFIAQDPNRLSKAARDILVDENNAVFVSVVTAGELACLAERKRIVLPQHWKPWFRACVDRNGWNLLPLTIEIMEEAYSLPEPIHRDPVDRILIATSRVEDMTIVTADRSILDYPHVKSRA
ncbi:MAG: type II toxin-antitoxin system VapC family toxin [Verrucomicrobiota bacterium]